VNKDYYWGWFSEDEDKAFLLFGDLSCYDYDGYEKIVRPSGISADKLLEYLQSEASNANRHHMVDGYQRLFTVLESNLYEGDVKTVLRGIIEAGGIHDE
jgi:hypothetical protein